MKKIRFTESKIKGLYEYHHHPKEEVLIEYNQSFLSNPVLKKQWVEAKENALFEEFALTNVGTLENILLYNLLFSALTTKLELYGIGIEETDTIQYSLKQKPLYVNWEYHLEHEQIIKDKYRIEDVGFRKAASPQIFQFGKPIQKTPTTKTGLFYISGLKQLLELQKPYIGNACYIMNLFAVQPGRFLELVRFLQSSQTPRIEDFLNDEEVFMASYIANDVGYYDYLVIKSKTSLSDRLNKITDKLGQLAEEYINEVQHISVVPELLNLLNQLIKKYAL